MGPVSGSEMTPELRSYKALKAKIKKNSGTLMENVELILSGIRAAEAELRASITKGDGYGIDQHFGRVLHYAFDISIMIRMNAAREQIAEACVLVSRMSRGTASPPEVWLMTVKLYDAKPGEALRLIGRDPKEGLI